MALKRNGPIFAYLALSSLPRIFFLFLFFIFSIFFPINLFSRILFFHSHHLSFATLFLFTHISHISQILCHRPLFVSGFTYPVFLLPKNLYQFPPLRLTHFLHIVNFLFLFLFLTSLRGVSSFL